MTTVVFLRHGPTQENKEGKIQGQQPGTLLLPETQAYVAALVPFLRPKNPQFLVCSDLERAVKTCEIVKDSLQLPDMKLTINPLLREKAMGYYEGMLWRDVPEEFQKQRGQTTFDFRKFGGESDEDMKNRVMEVLRRFASQYPDARIACVTHAGWIQQLVMLADKQGVLPDGWSSRTAIYETGLSPIGQFQYFHPINIENPLEEEASE